jgi:integrase
VQLANLTDRAVEQEKPDPMRRREVRDGKVRGLVLRISETGVKSWSVLYRRKADGRRRRSTCGQYPHVGLAEARTRALGLLARVARGEDPAMDDRRVFVAGVRTFGDLAKLYLTQAEKTKRSAHQDRQMLEKDVLPSLGTAPLDAIRRSDIGQVIQGIVARGSPTQANRCFEVIRGLYNWALGAGLVETTPCLGLKAPSPEQSRDRNLSPEETRLFWSRLSVAPMSWSTGQILRLCLVTGQRVGEVAGARRSELNLKGSEWCLPAHRVKNGCAHAVPLSPFAMELVEEALCRSTSAELIFPSAITKRSITGHAVAKAMSRSLVTFGFEDATPHDLRRTAATGMAKLGIARLVIDKVLNHVSADRSNIAGVYDRHAYEQEKRQALERWADSLSCVIQQ